MVAEPKPVTPWPMWGRVLFFVVFALVIAAAVVAAIRGGALSSPAARVAVIVVAVPGLALLFVSSVLRGRASRTTTRLAPEIADALAEVRAEQSRSSDQRASGASDDTLGAASEALLDAQRRLTSADLDGATTVLGSLHGTAAPWRSSPLSDAVAACERSARRLRRTTDTLNRQRR